MPKPAFFAMIFTVSTAYGISFALFAICMQMLGASTQMIGWNAAMPALGWLIGTPLVPWALRHMSLDRLAATLLMVALLAWAVICIWHDAAIWLVSRLFFGGALGLFYRCVEFWLTEQMPDAIRGRGIGLYNTCFLGGLAIGTALQTALGTGLLGFGAVGMGLGAVILALRLRLGADIIARTETPMLGRPSVWMRPSAWLRVTLTAPLAMGAVATYALAEQIPGYFMAISALRMGLGETAAALTLTMFVLGGLLGAVPGGVLSDRFGRRPVILGAAVIGMIGAVALPFLATKGAVIFLAGLFVWSLAISNIYTAALAMLGDHFGGETLLLANVVFGMVYALGALLGPIYSTALMAAWPAQGLFWAAGLLFAALTLVMRTTRV